MSGFIRPEDFGPLLILLKSPSKKLVAQLFEEVFRKKVEHEDEFIGALEIQKDEFTALCDAVAKLTHHCLYNTFTEEKEVIAAFPGDFHPNLSQLIAKLIVTQTPSWREHLQSKQISMPKLVDIGWRIDLKVASDSVPHMNIPTSIMSLKVEDPMDEDEKEPKTVTFELTRETLNTMLDGLKKIQEQLGMMK